ncbi:MAG: GNAT family N-acetyltransferase, partial [Muribaculaceae bacterium]|nr:GNAT family N-acetyltransferase [Muribaculaceae bacterium]
IMWHLTILTDYDYIFSDDCLNRYIRYLVGAECSNVCWHPILLGAWYDSYNSIRRLSPWIVWATDNNTGNVAMFPLVVWRRNLISAFARVVLPMGGLDLDYHEPIFKYRPTAMERQNFFDTVFKEIVEHVSPDVILFDGMMAPLTSTVFEVSKVACPWCDLTKYDSKDIVKKLIGERAVSEIERRYRRLRQEGEIGLYHYNKKDVIGCEESLKRMLECHAERWPRAFKAPGLHATLIKRGVEAGIVDFSELRVGGKPVSWYIAMMWGSTYSLYMPAWEKAYRNRGVGKMHLAMLATEMAKRGMTRLDFMRGDEPYKAEWCDNKDYVFDCKARGRTIRSRLVNTIL